MNIYKKIFSPALLLLAVVSGYVYAAETDIPLAPAITEVAKYADGRVGVNWSYSGPLSEGISFDVIRTESVGATDVGDLCSKNQTASTCGVALFTNSYGVLDSGFSSSKTYYYKVRAISSDGVVGPWSEAKLPTPAPLPPLILSYSSATGQFSWNPYPAAGYYKLVRSQTSLAGKNKTNVSDEIDGSPTGSCLLSSKICFVETDQAGGTSINASTRSLSDKNFDVSKTYYYRLVVYEISGILKPLEISNEILVPGSPDLISESKNDGVSVKFPMLAEFKPLAFSLYRSTSSFPNLPASPIESCTKDSTSVCLASSTQVSIYNVSVLDKNVKPGSIYYYRATTTYEGLFPSRLSKESKISFSGSQQIIEDVAFDSMLPRYTGGGLYLDTVRGSDLEFTLVFKNTGNVTLDKNIYFLTEKSTDVSTWRNPAEGVYSMLTDLAPGQVVTFKVKLKAPQEKRNYVLSWQMAKKEGVNYRKFGQASSEYLTKVIDPPPPPPRAPEKYIFGFDTGFDGWIGSSHPNTKDGYTGGSESYTNSGGNPGGRVVLSGCPDVYVYGETDSNIFKDFVVPEGLVKLKFDAKAVNNKYPNTKGLYLDVFKIGGSLPRSFSVRKTINDTSWKTYDFDVPKDEWKTGDTLRIRINHQGSGSDEYGNYYGPQCDNASDNAIEIDNVCLANVSGACIGAVPKTPSISVYDPATFGGVPTKLKISVPMPDDKVVGYKIYRSTIQNFPLNADTLSVNIGPLPVSTSGSDQFLIYTDTNDWILPNPKKDGFNHTDYKYNNPKNPGGGLNFGQIYYYKVVAYNGSGDSLPSTELKVQTLATAPYSPVPSIKSRSGASIELIWPKQDNAVSYAVIRSLSPGLSVSKGLCISQANKNDTCSVAVSTALTSITDTIPDPSKIFYYRVVAMAIDGRTSDLWSTANELKVSPLVDNAVADGAVVGVPVQVTPGSSFGVQVKFKNTGSTTWIPPFYLMTGDSSDSTKFLPVNNTGLYGLVAGSSIATNQSYVFDISLTAPTQAGDYTLRWKMAKNGQTPEKFGTATADVKVSVKNPPSVTTVGVDSVTTSVAMLKGNTVPNGLTGFIQTFEYGLTPTTLTPSASVGQSTGGDFSFNLTGLTPDTIYYYKAVAKISGTSGVQTYEGELKSFRTLVLPTPPTNVSVSASGNNVTIGWTAPTTAPSGAGPLAFYQVLRSSSSVAPTSFQNCPTSGREGQVPCTQSDLDRSTDRIEPKPLSAGTYYYFVRAIYSGSQVGSYVNGPFSNGVTLVVTPSVTTLDSESITSSSATLKGRTDARGLTGFIQTFEYGLTPTTLTPSASVGQSTGGDFSFNLTGLTPDTIYYYKAVAGLYSDSGQKLWKPAPDGWGPPYCNLNYNPGMGLTFYSGPLVCSNPTGQNLTNQDCSVYEVGLTVKTNYTIGSNYKCTIVKSFTSYEGEVKSFRTLRMPPIRVSLDASSPSFAKYPGGTTGLVSSVLRVSAHDEDVLLNSIGFKLTSGSPLDIVSGGVYVKDENNLDKQIGNITFGLGGSLFATSTLSEQIEIKKNEYKLFTVKIDLSQTGIGQSGTVGHVVAVNWNGDDPFGTTGIGVDSGTTIRVSGTTTNAPGIEILETLPSVTTLDSESITSSSATLKGRTDARGLTGFIQTFEYGLTPTTLTPSASVGQSTGGDFSFNLTGLTPDTIYYYKAVAKISGTSGVQTYEGELKSFRTNSCLYGKPSIVQDKNEIIELPTIFPVSIKNNDGIGCDTQKFDLSVTENWQDGETFSLGQFDVKPGETIPLDFYYPDENGDPSPLPLTDYNYTFELNRVVPTGAPEDMRSSGPKEMVFTVKFVTTISQPVTGAVWDPGNNYNLSWNSTSNFQIAEGASSLLYLLPYDITQEQLSDPDSGIDTNVLDGQYWYLVNSLGGSGSLSYNFTGKDISGKDIPAGDYHLVMSCVYDKPEGEGYDHILSYGTYCGGNDTFSAIVDRITILESISAPQNFSLIERSKSTNDAVLGWQEVDNATKYQISRREEGTLLQKAVNFFGGAQNQTAETVIDVSPNTTVTFRDNIPSSTKTYLYKIRSVSSDNRISDWSEEISVAPIPAPVAPTGLIVEADESTVLIKGWNEVPEAVGYKVLRGNNNNFDPSGWTLVADVTDSPTATAPISDSDGIQVGTKYYYAVVAYNAGGTSLPSNVVEVVPFAPVSAPSGLRLINRQDKNVSIGWNASTEAGRNVNSYVVERRSVPPVLSLKGMVYRFVGAVGSLFTQSDAGFVVVGEVNKTSFDDTLPNSTDTYFYRVKGIGSADQSSDWSIELEVKPEPRVTLSIISSQTQIEIGQSVDITVFASNSVVGTDNKCELRVSETGEVLLQTSVSDTRQNVTHTPNISGDVNYIYQCSGVSPEPVRATFTLKVSVPAGFYAPKSVSVVSVGDSDRISWVAVPAASGYEIFRGDSSILPNQDVIDNISTRSCTVSGSQMEVCVYKNIRTNSQDINRVPSVGDRYYYWVRASKRETVGRGTTLVFSDWSGPVKTPLNYSSTEAIPVLDLYLPDLRLSWNQIDDVSSYQIEKTTILNDGSITVTTLFPSPVNSNNYVDSLPPAGVSYAYRVKAINSFGVSSGWSNVENMSAPQEVVAQQTPTTGTYSDNLTLSYPVLQLQGLPSDSLVEGDNVLMRFAIGADASGDIAIGKITFALLTNNVSLENASLYVYDDPVFSVGGRSLVAPFTVGLGGQALKEIVFRDVNGTISPIKISAGTEKYFEIKAKAVGVSVNSSVSSNIYSDQTPPANVLNTFGSVEADNGNDSFIWSPYKATSAPQETDPVWTNSYYSVGLIEDISLTITP